jgi:hypothetical protein
MELSDERASARTGDVCPEGGSEFGRVAAAIDEAENVSWDRIGGPSRADTEAVSGLERRLAPLRPSNASDWTWLARRLARALENGWHARAVKPLLRLAD